MVADASAVIVVATVAVAGAVDFPLDQVLVVAVAVAVAVADTLLHKGTLRTVADQHTVDQDVVVVVNRVVTAKSNV